MTVAGNTAQGRRNPPYATVAEQEAIDPLITLQLLDGTSNMTYYGHMKTINISTLKAHLSAELKKVRRGGRLVVMDRETPIAELVPYKEPERLLIRPPQRKLEYPRQIPSLGIDPLEALLADRRAR
jgi:prevent-host-death family protein